MSSLYLPAGVTHELYDARVERENKAHASGVFVRDERCRELNPLLFRVDPYLSLVFCNEPAPLEAVACGARPGRYNIVRESPGQPLTFIPVVGPDGEYVDAGSNVFDLLEKWDMWDDRVMRDRRKRENEIRAGQEKTRQEERRQRDQEGYERWRALTQTSISMNSATPWSQNVAGRRASKG